MAIHAGLQLRAKGAQTEIARAMQAFTVPVGARNTINIGNIKNELLNESGGREAAMDLVNAIKKGETEGGKKGMSEAIARGWAERSKKVFQEIYINGLLANTKTALKNLLATPLYIAYNQLTDIVAASTMTVVRSGQKALGKEINPDGVFFSDIFAPIFFKIVTTPNLEGLIFTFLIKSCELFARVVRTIKNALELMSPGI